MDTGERIEVTTGPDLHPEHLEMRGSALQGSDITVSVDDLEYLKSKKKLAGGSASRPLSVEPVFMDNRVTLYFFGQTTHLYC
jgi:hypothetical protein